MDELVIFSACFICIELDIWQQRLADRDIPGSPTAQVVQLGIDIDEFGILGFRPLHPHAV